MDTAGETPPEWTDEDTKVAVHTRIFDIHSVRSRSPRTGQLHEFTRIVSPDWVNIIPLNPDGGVVMVRQYRHGSSELTLEIPGGMVDPDEIPAAAAARELREETGYAGDSVEALGSVAPNPALFDNRCHSFLVRDVSRVDHIRNEGAEETAVEIHPLAEVPRLIREGAITHALVIAAFHWLSLHEDGGADG
jgi:ADP-ribose pyrophosphatase